jgi:predicted transcriptional regulator
MEDSIEMEAHELNALITRTSDIVSAYVANNSLAADQVATLVSGVYSVLAKLDTPQVPTEPVREIRTRAQVRRSITPDALISFIDGKPYKTLKRHLAKNGLSLEEYRALFGLPADYPATAPGYSAQRAELARSQGLGKRHRTATARLSVVAGTNAETPRVDKRRRATS